MANKRKVTTAIAAGVTAAALLLGGTFAWQSINQTALNEASDVINPGGRLHDDFNGSNKDVYVENFADEDIFARIRLDEYFEIIMNKGVEGAERIDSIAGEKDEDGNIIAWETHKFDGSDATAEYWEWASGGSTVYMPTFNKNKDSLAADINGTYQGEDGIVTDEATDDRYTDYVTYEADEPKTGNAIYDIDANMADELTGGGVDIAGLINGTVSADGYTDNVTLVPEEHTAKETLGATLISMTDWMALPEDQQVGEYWVYDTDGWVYWAQPIKPGTATGKLLDSIKLTQVMDDSWYYAINVVAQFITADDLGKTDGTGFYDAENGAIPSDNALALLEKIGVDTTGEAPMIDVIMLDGVQTDEVNLGKEYTVSVGQVSAYSARSASSYTFSLKEEVEGVTLADATLTIGADKAVLGSTFTVVATDDAGETIEATYTVVKSLELSFQQVGDDGIDEYGRFLVYPTHANVTVTATTTGIDTLKWTLEQNTTQGSYIMNSGDGYMTTTDASSGSSAITFFVRQTDPVGSYFTLTASDAEDDSVVVSYKVMLYKPRQVAFVVLDGQDTDMYDNPVTKSLVDGGILAVGVPYTFTVANVLPDDKDNFASTAVTFTDANGTETELVAFDGAENPNGTYAYTPDQVGTIKVVHGNETMTLRVVEPTTTLTLTSPGYDGDAYPSTVTVTKGQAYTIELGDGLGSFVNAGHEWYSYLGATSYLYVNTETNTKTLVIGPNGVENTRDFALMTRNEYLDYLRVYITETSE